MKLLYAEIKFLLEAINEEKAAIFSRLQTSVTVKKKKEAWGRAVDKVNAGARMTAETSGEI